MNRSTLLIIDDDERFRERLAKAFVARGLEVLTAPDSSTALGHLSSRVVDRVVLDLKLEEESGLALLPLLLERQPQLQVVVLTGFGSIATAVQALRLGAANYVTKPLDAERILAAFSADSEGERVDGVEVPSLSRVEWEHIQRVLGEYGGNVSLAARALGMHRRSLQRKLAKGVS